MSLTTMPRNEITHEQTIQMRFLDGRVVDDAYAKAITATINHFCEAEERFGLDELERYARESTKVEVRP